MNLQETEAPIWRNTIKGQMLNRGAEDGIGRRERRDRFPNYAPVVLVLLQFNKYLFKHTLHIKHCAGLQMKEMATGK